MPTTDIFEFTIGAATNAMDDAVQQVTTILKALPGSPPFIVGQKLQDQFTIQIIIEHVPQTDPAIPFASLFTSLSEPTLHISAPLTPAISTTSLSTSPILEIAHSFFPTTRITPTLHKQILDEFNEFDHVCFTQQHVPGHLGKSWAWSTEEVTRNGVPGYDFTVVAGWKDMASFEKFLQTEAFKGAVGVLAGWEAGTTLVSTYRADWEAY